MPRTVAPLLLLLGLFDAAARAQESTSPGPIDTDRPDQTESSALVPHRHVQLEFGVGYSEDAPDDEVLEAPALLVRYGLIDRLELRFEIPTLTTQFASGAESDFSDPALGAKISLWAEKGWRPEAALLVGTTIPVGSNDISSNRFDPAFRFSFGHTLPRDLSFGYNLGVAWATAPEEDGSGHDTAARLEYTAALGYDFTERWGAFIEVFGDTPLNDSLGPAHSLDGGLTFLLRENIQFDLAGGFGLSAEAPDWFVTAGFSVRLPK
jgi:hypothetical protein